MGTEFCTDERENGRRGITVGLVNQRRGLGSWPLNQGPPAWSGLGYWGSSPADELAGFSTFDSVYLHDLLHVPAGIRYDLWTQPRIWYSGGKTDFLNRGWHTGLWAT